MKTSYSTTVYERTTHRKPRGYGAWMFEATFYGERFSETRMVFIRACHYGEAKNAAKKKAVAMIPDGIDVRELVLEVQP